MLLYEKRYLLKEITVMNRIKDFFYNKNDLIIVLLILVLAAGIIYHSVTDIMSYPETLNEQAVQTTSAETVQSESEEPTDEPTEESSYDSAEATE